jgi:hypothetical protein
MLFSTPRNAGFKISTVWFWPFVVDLHGVARHTYLVDVHLSGDYQGLLRG